MRLDFRLDEVENEPDAFEHGFAAEVAGPFAMRWSAWYAARRAAGLAQ